MSGRSRRVVQNKAAASVAAALEKLNAAKSGAKRVETFELKEEEAVYDVVDDESYAQLANKRRIEADDFIEDDAGEGEYMDTGDDELFGSGADEAAAGGKGKKRKGGDKDGSAAKRQAAEEAAKASRNKERLQQMFAKAAAQKPSAAKVDDKAGDDLLEGILMGLGGEEAKPAAAAAAGSSKAQPAASNAFSRARPAAQQPAAAKTFARGSLVAGRAGAGSGGSTAAAAAASRPAAAASAAGLKRRLEQQQQPAQSFSFGAGAAAAAGAADDDDDDAELGTVEGGAAGDDAAHEFSFALPGGDADVSDNPFDASTAASGAAAGANAASAAPTAADDTPAADDAAAGDTPAAAAAASGRRFADDVPSGPNAAASPATGWMEVYGPEGEQEAAAAPAAAPAAAGDGAAAVDAGPDGLEADGQGGVPFFFMDAYESHDRPDTLYLFGKVASNSSSSSTPSKSPGGSSAATTWQSCCVVVPNLHRSVLFVPAPGVFDDASGELAALEAAVAADPSRRMELLQELHKRCGELKAEIRALMLGHGVKAMRVMPVKRNYAFEDPAIPSRKQWVIKVRYSAALPALPLGLSGAHFVAVAGAQTSSLEALLVKRGLRGPGWTTLSAPTRREGSGMVSWCKVELLLANAKAITPAAAGTPLAARPAPPLTVAALSLRLHMDAKSRQQGILAASVVHLSGVSPDAPTPKAVWGSPQALRNFSVVRKLEGRPWPTGFEQLVASENASLRGRLNGGAMLATAPNERALLGCLLARLAGLDADVLVGHNIGAYELAVLLGCLQAHKVQLWSRLGRLKRSAFPKLTGGGHTFGGGAGPGVLSVLAGRLLCDTYLSARELVREVDYTLKTLAHSLLGQTRAEVAPSELPGRYESAQGLRDLLLLGESDAWLALGLAFQLSVLPLSKQLSVVSGSLWSRTLQGARAQRIEMLLLHEFHARKFILPDKLSKRDKAALADTRAAAAASGKGKGKKKAAAADEEYDGPALPDDEVEPEEEEQGRGGGGGAAAAVGLSKKSGGKGPQYAGGLVLEPKRGLYDKFVIMLDFNSLYPSIIQEYNICFTTVKRPAPGAMAALPSGADAGGGSGGLAPLPTVIQGLVRSRREVKAQMKHCRDPVLLQQLTIRQQALKLTANSMYGCLGFNNSRFFARPLAELITSQGRDILQSTVDLVQELGLPGLEVIYGDTDSIMIHTNSSDYEAAEQLGARIKAAVNRRYRLLEIELDAVYRSMLLLKKKKYAAVKVERGAPGSPLVEALEAKGLDMVRRDWCPLSKDTGNYALQQILSGSPKPEVVEAVHERLRQVADQLRGGQLPLGSFIITKQLTKRPEDYPDARAQPHVQVALRRRAAGKRDGVMAGETVPYVICLRQQQQQQQEGAAAGSAAVKQEEDGSQAQQQQQPAGAAAQEAAASPAAPKQQQQQDGSSSPAPAAASGSGVRTASAPAGGSNSSGGLAERAYHPDELRANPSLVVDAEYYLGQQVLPVVVRLCAPIEGTNAAHLAQCLGLDPSRYGGSSSSAGGSMAAALREEAMQVTGSLLDDEGHYAQCEPLTLASSNGSSWEFKGVRAALRSGTPGDALLTPPDAVGDAAAELSPAQLANQALLAARRAIVRYYDGQLVADDEMAAAAGAGECRDVVLAPAPPEAPPGSMPRPPAAAGSGSGLVLLSRAYSEDKLYTQLCHIVRLLDVNTALARLPDKQRRDAAHAQLNSSSSGGGSTPVVSALAGAAAAVAKLRDACGYRWVNLGQLFGKLRNGSSQQQQQQQRAGGLGLPAADTPVRVA